MNEIYVLITQPNYLHYEFFRTEKEAQDKCDKIKKFDEKSYAIVEKWDIVQFANWISQKVQILEY